MWWIRGAYWLGAIYGIALGLAVLVLGDSLFVRFEVRPPEYAAYYELPGFMLIIFGVLFAQIALNPVRQRVLMIYAMALKVSTAGLFIYHHFVDGLPGFLIPFAFADVALLVLFSSAYVATGNKGGDTHGAGAWG